MNVSLGGRLGAALACVLLLAFSSVAAAADQSAASTEQLRQLAARIYTATRGTEQAHAARTPLADGDVRIATDARKQFDALARDATIRGYASDANFARKAAQIAKLLANLERAQRAGPDANLPRLIPHAPAEDHVAHVQIGNRNGADCASAITIRSGYAIESPLAVQGSDRSTLWLRVAPGHSGFYRLDTAATPLDTEITLFGTECPGSEAEAIAHADDSFGLAAAVTIDAKRDPGLRYARIRNLGGAGVVIARVEAAGAIAGRVVDERSGQPLYTSVDTLTAEGFYGLGSFSGADGFYLVSMDPGSYYVLAGTYSLYDGFVPELYPDTPCIGPFAGNQCPLGGADLLALADGQEIAGIDFALNIGGRVSGVVRDADSGAQLAGAIVTILDGSGMGMTSTSTDVAGRYTIDGLVSGNYYVEADMAGRGSQRWDHVDCGGPVQTQCRPLDGTPLAVVRNQLSANIDFDLPLEASIHATATTAGAPDVPIQYWQFTVYDLVGNPVAGGYGYGTEGAVSEPLPPGSYRVAASAYGYFSQVWNGIDCPVDCQTQLANGAIVTLVRGQRAEIAFALQPMPVVSGTVTDAATHQPLEGISIGLIDADAPFGTINSATTRADGTYEVTGTPSGSYYVWAMSNGYRGTVYPDVPCPGFSPSSCDLAGAIAVTLAYGTPDSTGIDIAMPMNGSISGHVALRTPPGMSLPPIVPDFESIAIYDSNGFTIANSYVTIAGDFTVPGLPVGTYYAGVSGDAFGQLWHGIDCGANCDALAGTPIVIAQGENITGIDFDPLPFGYVFGRVTDGDGAPLGGVAIDLWNTTDTTHCGVSVTDDDGFYSAFSTSFGCNGTGFRASTDAGSAAYEDQVYDGIPCPAGPAYLGLCSLDDATVLWYPTTPAFVIANFVLGPRPDPIYASGFDP